MPMTVPLGIDLPPDLGFGKAEHGQSFRRNQQAGSEHFGHYMVGAGYDQPA
jgi:poly-gamma-glutamate capsule biosynthesis protein CapA/YwtB (metallophosphatase superfamily)